EDRSPIHVIVDQKPFAELKPGESKLYECSSAERNLRRIEVKEWPHIRGSLFVGEVGVVAQPATTGAFALQAPQGKYELEVMRAAGSRAKQPVEVAKADVDVGRILSSGAGASASGAADAPRDPGPATGPGSAAAPAKAPKKAVPPPAKKRPGPAPLEKPIEP